MPSSTLQPNSTNIAPQRRALWIPGLFVGLMGVVVAVNGALIYFATDTFSGLDTDHAYQEGLDYNATLTAAAASAALGWRAEVALLPTGQGDRLTLRLTDKSGKPVAGLKVTAHLVRPVSTAFDRVVELLPADGQYQADVALPARGKWEIRLVARGSGPEWQHTANVFLK